MSEKIIVPELGESITQATVAKWLKNKGDKVFTDEPLVELETDKVNLEVPSPINGVLSDINSNDGDTVEVGTILGLISEVEVKADTEKKQKKENIVREENNNLINSDIERQPEPKIFSEESSDQDPLILTNEISKDETEIKHKVLSPAVRKIVSDKRINIEDVEGSGKNGQILKGDLINLMDLNPKPNERKIKYGQEERIKMTRLRQTIAKRLKEAQENAAMLTTFNEVDMSNIIKMREENQNDFQERFGVKLGFMSFFVKASILGLKLFPAINAEIEGEEIIYKNYYNISFAVGTDRGLVVPVLKNADESSFADIEKNIKKLSEKAKEGNLNIEDLQGGTFTISNGGVYGSMLSTPIINPPQSGILGMHNIVKRAVVLNDEIKIRPLMYLALSYDHRIIDGKDSVSFLKTIKENLEDPRRLFLDI